jgi:hypothetical protein
MGIYEVPDGKDELSSYVMHCFIRPEEFWNGRVYNGLFRFSVILCAIGIPLLHEHPIHSINGQDCGTAGLRF